MCIVYEYRFEQFKNKLEILPDFIFEKITNMKFYKIHNKEMKNFNINDVLRYFSKNLIEENTERVINLIKEYQLKNFINYGDDWDNNIYKNIIESCTSFFSKKYNVFILNDWIVFNLEKNLLKIESIKS